MTLEEMKDRLGCWLDASGPNPEIVMSTRVRLARNLSGHRFAHRADEEELREILDEVVQAVREDGVISAPTVLAIDQVSEADRRFLMERHLVSNEMVSETRPAAVIIRK